MMSKRNPTLTEIKQARDECAKIISKYGDQYLPIFERLENEIVRQEEQSRLLNKALKIGTRNGTQNGTQIRNHFLTVSK